MIIVAAMATAGALAGLAGANQVLGVLGRATPGFSAGIGFDRDRRGLAGPFPPGRRVARRSAVRRARGRRAADAGGCGRFHRSDRHHPGTDHRIHRRPVAGARDLPLGLCATRRVARHSHDRNSRHLCAHRADRYTASRGRRGSPESCCWAARCWLRWYSFPTSTVAPRSVCRARPTGSRLATSSSQAVRFIYVGYGNPRVPWRAAIPARRHSLDLAVAWA